MAAVDLLRVQPQIRLVGQLAGELVVLPVVAADQDLKPVRRAKAHGPGGGLLHLLFLVIVFDVAALDQFLPNFGNVPLRLRAAERLEHRGEVGLLGPAGLQLLGEELFRVLGLVVGLVILCRVLLGRERDVQGDVDGLHLGVIEVDRRQAALAAADLIEVRRDNVAPLAQTLAVMGGRKLLFLHRQLAHHPAVEGGQRLVQGLRLGSEPLLPVAPGVKRLQKL